MLLSRILCHCDHGIPPISRSRFCTSVAPIFPVSLERQFDPVPPALRYLSRSRLSIDAIPLFQQCQCSRPSNFRNLTNKFQLIHKRHRRSNITLLTPNPPKSHFLHHPNPPRQLSQLPRKLIRRALNRHDRALPSPLPTRNAPRGHVLPIPPLQRPYLRTRKHQPNLLQPVHPSQHIEPQILILRTEHPAEEPPPALQPRIDPLHDAQAADQ